MCLFSKLSENEIDMIGWYIDEYANAYERTVSVEKILKPWDNAKSEYLSKIFKDKLILSKDIEFYMGKDELFEEMEGRLLYKYDENGERANCSKFIDEFRKIVIDPYYNKGWDSVEEDGTFSYDYYHALSGLFNSYDLIDNVYNGVTLQIPCPNSDKVIKITRGSKITRVLGKIAKEYSVPYFEDFRIAHSQVLNQKKLTGTMNISIHPLDYMTMSDNTCGWSSCMSWIEEGCYRQGTVEMMNSPMVIVAYLESTSDKLWFPRENRWNSKKWRQLFIINEDMIGNVKAYPYRNNHLTKIVLEWLKELSEEAKIGEYMENVIEYNAFEDFDLNGTQYRISPRTNLMYNDFSCEQFAYLSKNLPSGRLSPNYSGYSECMSCGRISCDFDTEASLVGYCCEEDKGYCESCGDRYHVGDLIDLDGQRFCEYCYNELAQEDSITEETHNINNMTKIFLMSSKGFIYYADIDPLYIYDLYNEGYKNNLSKYFKSIYRLDRIRNNSRFYVKYEDLTEEGKNLFWIPKDYFNDNNAWTESINLNLTKDDIIKVSNWKDLFDWRTVYGYKNMRFDF